MRRFRHLVAGAAVAIAAIAGGDATSGATARRITVTGAILKGANEVGTGDPDGIGAAVVVIDTNGARLCYFVAVRGIAPATMAHIHRGPAGVNGPVVVNFEAPSDGVSADCISVAPALATEIAGNVRGFYVNVHNDDFQGGAIRGQLR